MRIAILITISVVFLSCSKNKPSQLSQEEKRLAIAYTELFKLRQRVHLQRQFYQDSAAAVLKKLQFSKENYDLALASLNKNPERWEYFYREVQALMTANKSLEAAPR